MFSKNRAIHQQVTPAEMTGEISTAALLCGVERKIGSFGHKSQKLMDFTAMRFGWLGCLDAPDCLPTGGVRAVYIGGEFEGMAAINQHREVCS